MKVVGIIPSRYASSRFPGKPLADIFGKPMIQRVYEQAKKSSLLTDVIVATDDERIERCVLAFGGKVCMTAATHQSGTDRCAEVVGKLYADFDVAINIQGDEPYIHPQQIDELAACFKEEEVLLATLIKKIENAEDIFNPNRIKVVTDKNKNALYFSRSPIPFRAFMRNNASAVNASRMADVEVRDYCKHIGIYGYRTSVLMKITAIKPSPLELAESLEQLRWLENGFTIKTRLTTYESVSIDVPEDMEKLANE